MVIYLCMGENRNSLINSYQSYGETVREGIKEEEERN